MLLTMDQILSKLAELATTQGNCQHLLAFKVEDIKKIIQCFIPRSFEFPNSFEVDNDNLTEVICYFASLGLIILSEQEEFELIWDEDVEEVRLIHAKELGA